MSMVVLLPHHHLPGCCTSDIVSSLSLLLVLLPSSLLGAEVEFSRMPLASRTHFEVLGLGLEDQVFGLGLGLEASSSRKLACPRLEDSIIF